MSQTQILVVGAGPTGLNLALRLAHERVPFRIIDKNDGPGTASRAMAVHARTLEFYQQLGFAQDIVDRGIKTETMHLREGDREVARISLKDMGSGLSPFPFVLTFPQDDHERFLVDRLQAAGVTIEWGVTLDRFTQDADKVHAVLDNRGTPEEIDVAYLCGCDGARSRVREGLKLDFPGGTYEHLYYVADVKLRGDQDTDGRISIGPGTFVMRLPVRSSGMFRLIGVASEDQQDPERLTFEDVRASSERLAGVEVEDVNWFSTYRVHHRVAAHFHVGRCFLAGDAGHLHSPAGGQGMNTGIGDAVNLAWKLAHVVQGRASPAILDTYEVERIGFARNLVATTDRVFQAIISRSAGISLVRSRVLPYVLPLLTGFAAARRQIFKTVSQVRISYRDSSLSAGRAGQVQGGDRLPWVPTEGADNFEPLRSLNWQLHVYGKAAPELSKAAESHRLRVITFPWSDKAGEMGLERNAAYLVRPDAYVALAMPTGDIGKLEEFAQRFSLGFETAAAAG